MAVMSLDALKARAEAMRRAGASMAEISRAVGRSPSTLHLWAAQGGWRIVDLEVEGLDFFKSAVPSHAPDSLVIPAPPGAARETTDSDSAGARMECAQGCDADGSEFAASAPQKDDRPPDFLVIPAPPGAAGETTEGPSAGARMECPQGWGDSGSEFEECPPQARDRAPSGQDAPPEPVSEANRARGTELSPLEAAKALHHRSAVLGQAGQVRAAEATARLAERILRTEAQLLRIDIANPEPDPEGHDQWPGGAGAELARRFARIRAVHDEFLAQDPDWTPEKTGWASEADRFVFSLYR